jgi:hydrogenase large subunit
MSTKIVIDPVTRLEGHLKVEVTVDQVNGKQQVVAANSVGTMFRGFENILKGRSPLDSPDITQRICGVCPVSHGVVASKALEAAAGMTIPTTARIMRNLVLGANFLQSHILHFYHLALQDYVNGPNMAPWQPSWTVDKRYTPSEEQALVNNYVQALDMRRQSHEMGALFAGKLPHVASFVAGGVTRAATSTNISRFKTYLAAITNFISTVYMKDVDSLASRYVDYLALGGGYGHLLAYGVFDLDSTGTHYLLQRGSLEPGQAVKPLDLSRITESVTRSWYSSGNNLNPASGATTAQYPKTGAYSWLKAPRYAGKPFEAGPLARMCVNGDYPAHVSVMDRHQARAHEALKIATAMATWAGQLSSGGSARSTYHVPTLATGVGLGEAPRGALGHWLSISGGTIANYQIVTPTCWNASPRDSAGQPGPIEQALIGTPVADLQQPVEVLRVIHAFDPCLSCAVHVMRPAEGARIIALGAFPHEESREYARSR